MIQHQKETSLIIRGDKVVRICYLNQIIHIEGGGHHCEITTKDNEKLVHAQPIGKLEEMLFSYGFIRISRNMLLNLRHLVEYRYSSNKAIIVCTKGKEYEVSRRKSVYLKKMIESFFGINNSNNTKNARNATA